MMKVVIVGAGLAGISAADQLHQNGIEFRILEGRSRIGGRIFTMETENGQKLELGANWIHGATEQHSLYKVAKQSEFIIIYSLKGSLKDLFYFSDWNWKPLLFTET